jgi:hypothetical protein
MQDTGLREVVNNTLDRTAARIRSPQPAGPDAR